MKVPISKEKTCKIKNTSHKLGENIYNAYNWQKISIHI